jgi:predicted O-methyltransferase YrrM
MSLVDFKNFTRSDIQALVHTIGLLGDNIVGVELGVFEGASFLTLLHNCPNIKTLHGVDIYKPYDDYIKIPYDGTVGMKVDKPTSEIIRAVSFTRQKYSGMTDKIVFHEDDSTAVASKFEDESIDFIFMDSYCSYDQAKRELEAWFPKVKKGGLFSGHDWESYPIQKAVNEFRRENRMSNTLIAYSNTWSWRK